MKKIIITLALSFSVLSCTSLLANNAISVSHGKYSDYYHIKYTLTKNNFKIVKDTDPSYNGQFELLLNKSEFPIKAKNCKSDLILRMPSTLKGSENSAENINEKISLFNKIKAIINNEDESVSVVIELNPYVIVKSEKPLILELENCNIFFRANKNKYINHL